MKPSRYDKTDHASEMLPAPPYCRENEGGKHEGGISIDKQCSKKCFAAWFLQDVGAINNKLNLKRPVV